MSKKIDQFTELATQPANTDLFLLELASNGQYRKIKWQNVVADGSITTTKLAGSAVTSSKINFGGAGAGLWWEEIARTTLISPGNTISVTSIPSRTYLKFYFNCLESGALAISMRLNNDTAANYAFRYNANGTLNSGVSATSITSFGSGTEPFSGEGIITNVASKQKTGHITSVGSGTSAATAPDYVDFWFSWINTSAQINRIDLLNGGAGNFAIGSEVIILGHN